MGWLALVFLVGCAPMPVAKTTDAKTSANPPVLALAGESFEYRVELRGLTVGRVRVAMGEAGVVGSNQAVIARARADTDGVAMLFGKGSYELHTTLDLDDDKPIDHREEMWLEVPGMKRKQMHRDDRDGEHDAHSAIALLRGWRARPGEQLAVHFRVLDARLDVETWVAGREYLPASHTHAIHYEGMLESEHRFAAWVSDDPSRVPLRFELGSELGMFVVQLVAYQPPQDRP